MNRAPDTSRFEAGVGKAAMIRGVIFSKSRAAASSTGMAAAFAMVWLQHHSSGISHEHFRRNAELELNLVGQIETLSGFEDRDLEALRAQVSKFRVQLGPEDEWERLVSQLGRDWNAILGQMADKDGYTTKVGTFRLLSPVTSDWPRIIDAIGVLEQIPGSGIVGFQMKTSGDQLHRSVDLVRIDVAIQSFRPSQNPLKP